MSDVKPVPTVDLTGFIDLVMQSPQGQHNNDLAGVLMADIMALWTEGHGLALYEEPETKDVVYLTFGYDESIVPSNHPPDTCPYQEEFPACQSWPLVAISTRRSQ